MKLRHEVHQVFQNLLGKFPPELMEQLGIQEDAFLCCEKSVGASLSFPRTWVSVSLNSREQRHCCLRAEFDGSLNIKCKVISHLMGATYAKDWLNQNGYVGLIMPRRHKTTPSSPLFGIGVNAAL